MDSTQAASLVGGQKIRYWDGRIATVVVAYDSTTEEIVIEFDADAQIPKARNFIKSFDFLRAEPL